MLKRLWKYYSLSVVLVLMFLFSWVLQTWTGWMVFAHEQKSHGQAAQWFGDDGYLWEWLQATTENWQSEFLQLFLMVMLTVSLHHKGSPQSRDSEDIVENALDRIEEKLGTKPHRKK